MISEYFKAFSKLTGQGSTKVENVHLSWSEFKRTAGTGGYVADYLRQSGIRVIENGSLSSLNEWNLGELAEMSTREAVETHPGFPFLASFDHIKGAETQAQIIERATLGITNMMESVKSEEYGENDAIVLCSHGNFILWTFALLHSELDVEQAKGLYAWIMEKQFTLPNARGIIVEFDTNLELPTLHKVNPRLKRLMRQWSSSN